MSVQNHKINIRPNGDKYINIPINITFDLLGRDHDIDVYERKVIKDIIGEPEDFEVSRFSHEPNNVVINGTPINQTKLIHEFNLIENVNNITYKSSYLSKFTDRELYYYANSFRNSFFKLDFYDTPNSNDQTNYVTQIIPTQQGLTEEITLFKKKLKIRRPYFELDFIGDKEGFFVYWLNKISFLNIDKFYVSAKFFDAKKGQFIRFLNGNSNGIQVTKNFNQTDYFYYEYKLDYKNLTYRVSEYGLKKNSRVGINGSPIKWYEYINP